MYPHAHWPVPTCMKSHIKMHVTVYPCASLQCYMCTHCIPSFKNWHPFVYILALSATLKDLSDILYQIKCLGSSILDSTFTFFVQLLLWFSNGTVICLWDSTWCFVFHIWCLVLWFEPLTLPPTHSSPAGSCAPPPPPTDALCPSPSPMHPSSVGSFPLPPTSQMWAAQ